MDPKTWPILDRLLDDVLDLPPSQRDAWIDALGPEYDELKPRLRAMVARGSGEDGDPFLNTLPKIDATAGRDQYTAPLPQEHSALNDGVVVGPYRLVRPLGEGGMGTVWVAERSDGMLKRPVALKLPRGGAVRTDLRERISRERDILAALTHPNIARLYDAGLAADGQPYLALELIEGVAVTEYAAPLDLRARLRVFLQITRAIAYAHAKLVVHRDLKPSNILVTDDGQVKLLDFGIARLLDESNGGDTPLTEFTGRPFTPEYASPEQIAGEPLTVAADVYSLGIVLYELLTGVRPHRPRRASRAAVEEAVLRQEVVRPSDAAANPRVRKMLQGDLDTIILKALKKQPDERYPTADAFADDIDRHLNGHPVVARPDSMGYRVRKFVGRNRFGVAAAGLVLAAIFGGAGTAVWQMVEATEQRDAALQSQRRAEAYAEFMKVLLQDAGASGRPLTVAELLDRGTSMLERQEYMDESVAAYMRYEISRNYLMFNLTERQLSLLERSAEGARRLADANLLAASECSASWALMDSDRNRAEAKLTAGERALASANNVAAFSRADCQLARSRVLQMQGDIAGAIAAIREGLEFLDRASVQTWSRRDLLVTQLSAIYRSTERFKDALELSERSLNEVRASGREGSLLEITALNNHAVNLMRVGEIAQGAQLERQALDRAQRLDSRVPPISLKTNHGFTLLRLAEPQQALDLALAALEDAERVGNRSAAALSRLLASRALLAIGRVDEATEHLRAAEVVWQSDARMFSRLLIEAALHRTEIHLANNRMADAQSLMDATLTGLGYPNRKDAPGADRALRLAARIALQTGNLPLAQRLATDALERSRTLARNERASADVGLAALLRARALSAKGMIQQALDDGRLAVEGLRHGLGPEHSDTMAATSLVASLQGAARGRQP